MGPNSSKLRNHIFRQDKTSPVQSIEYDKNWLETIASSFLVVWCDATIGLNTNIDDDRNTLLQLTPIINKKRQVIHTFNEPKSCQEFIKNAHQICLIVSGSMGKELIPLVHNWKQIHSIFIFCIRKSKYESWAKQYPKIRGVYTDIRDICECLKHYFHSSIAIDYEQLQMEFLNKNYSQIDLSLFTYSILIRILIFHFQTHNHEKLIDYCRNVYKQEYQIQLINDFEQHSTKHNAIWWFTRDSFFQQILHRALQIHDFYALTMMSSFIQEIDLKLIELNRQQISTTPNEFFLYTSQLISKENFEKFKVNQDGFLCINQYILANTDKKIAFMFIENQNMTLRDLNTMNILLEISICQTHQSNVPFANISSISEFVHDKEHLISMSSIYRIEKIYECTELSSTWCVRLKLMDKYDNDLTKILQTIDEQYLPREIDLFNLTININKKLSQYQSTPRLYEQQTNCRTKYLRSILLHYNLGIIFDCLNEYDKALEEYKTAIDLTRTFILPGAQKDSLCLIPLYSYIGLTYQYLHMNKHAFEHAYRTLQILSEEGANSIYRKDLSASSHFNLGIILELQDKYQEAKSFYEQALKYRQSNLPTNHPDIIQLQETIQRLTME